MRAGLPLHGANLFPSQVPELRGAVLDYLQGRDRDRSCADGRHRAEPRLDPDYFYRTYTADPTVLFRIFHYPRDARPIRRTGAWASTPTTAC